MIKTEKPNENRKDICPECSNRVIVEDGKNVCPSCGLVLKDRRLVNSIRRGTGGYVKDRQENNVRSVGKPNNILNHNLGIGGTTFNIYEGSQSFRKRFSLMIKTKRIYWYSGNSTSKAKLVKNSRAIINDLKNKFNLDIFYGGETMRLMFKFRKNSEKEIRGLRLKRIVGSCFVVVLRIYDKPITIRKVANFLNVRVGLMQRTIKRIFKTLDIPYIRAKPTIFIPYYCSRLNINLKNQVRIKKILLRLILEKRTGGKSLLGYVLGIIYYLGRHTDLFERVRYIDLQRVSESTEATIRNRYKEIKKWINKVKWDGYK